MGKQSRYTDYSSVKLARSKLKTVPFEYNQNPSKNKKKALELAKKNLDKSYLNAEVDFINGKIADISSLHISKKHHAAWKTIGEISGKRSKPTIRIKGALVLK